MINHFSYSTSENYDKIRNKLSKIDTHQNLKYDINYIQTNQSIMDKRNFTSFENKNEKYQENKIEVKPLEMNQSC